MSLSLIVLHLAGAATLLLWAVRMVRTGVERAQGPALRRTLRESADNQIQAAAVGLGTAVLLQSSTAVAILASGFASNGMITLPTGLAMLLGADLGSALVVQILSFDLSWLMPFFLISGGWLFLKGTTRNVKQTGRILMGIGLVLTSLTMMSAATEPLRHSELLPVIVGYLSGDFVTAFLLAAAFTWLVHSSIATILLIMAFAAQGLVPAELGLSLMLGANLGAGLIAVGLTREGTSAARRLPLGNLIFRSVGATAALLALQLFDLPYQFAGESAARQIINLHLGFNLALIVICLPLSRVIDGLLIRLVPDLTASTDPSDPMFHRASALDRSVMDTPRLALASATRELLRMGELVEVMLRPLMDLYETGDKERIKQIKHMDAEVNAAHTQIKFFISELNQGMMTSEESARSIELTSFAINLEAAGDIIAKNLLKLAGQKRDKGLEFSNEGWRELTDLHDQVLSNMQLAFNVLVSGDPDSARQLIEEKDRIRDLERESHHRHLQRFQSGAIESIETSDIHLETVRGLKQINSAMASIAYSILAETGDLLDSRLAQPV